MSAAEDTFDVVIVAAGSGTRLGFSTPKAFVPVGGKPMLLHSVACFAAHPKLSHIILVVPENLIEDTKALCTDYPVTVVAGGAERWESVRNGCSNATAPWILVHDAARPMVTAEIIDALLALQSDFRCAFTATPVVDTIRTFDGNIAGETVDRSTLVRVGTPQMFETRLLKQAFEKISLFSTPPTDEVMLVQELGERAGIAPGDTKNFKITTKDDLDIVSALLLKNN